MPRPLRDRLKTVIRWRGVGPYPAAAAIALATFCALDMIVDPGPRDRRVVVFLIGLVLGVATLHGVLWQALHGLVRRLPRSLALYVWPLATLAAATTLATRLGAFSRLVGRYQLLAVGVLCACGIGALAFGALLSAMQPTARHARGYFASRSALTRILVVLAMLGGAAALTHADRTLYVGTYAIAHLALQICALWLLMFGLVLCDAWVRLPRLSAPWLLLICGWFAVPLARLDERDPHSMQGFAMRTWPSLVVESARAVLDFDADGYSSLLGGSDCAPLDSRISPGARETPGNGIDDNCILGDAPRRASPPAQPSAATPGKPSPIDVVLITIDTLRPDHLGVYAAAHRRPGRITTPNLDRWASDATVFRRAYTPGGWTSIALPSMMRGVYPRRLRWTRYYETNYFHIVYTPLDPRVVSGREAIAQLFPFAYRDPRPPLAERLRLRGMRTVAVVDDGPSEMLQRGLGFELGFTELHETDDLPAPRRGDRGTTELALEVLATLPEQQRFFLWVHYFGPHLPDETHPGVPTFGGTEFDRYDHEIAYLDQQLQPLLAALEQRSPAPAVFVAADHGEMLYANLRHHGMTLDEAAIRIPLIARVPGWPRMNVNRLVSLVDITPTILTLTQSPVPSELDGVDLNPQLEPTGSGPRILLTDTWRYEPNSRASIDFVGAYDGRHKLVLDRVHQYLLSYDASDAATRLPPDHELRSGPLYRALYGYLDETGGQLDLND
jgi:arylsulfatase A-like enzyme